jgi:nickel-dependent lactate racemase
MAERALREAGLESFLETAARDRVPLTVVVNDAHRFTDTRSFLDALFAVIGDARAFPAGLRVLVAAGSHRSTPEERAAHEARVLGPWAARFTTIAWHDARDPSGLARVGGHELHAWMSERGHYLGCGSMEPHYFAGVTGAHKTLTVGVMALTSLTANHEHAMSEHAGGLRLAGNPVHEGIVRAVSDLETSGARLFALNQVIVNGAVAACTAGHPLAALANGLPIVRTSFAHQVPRPLDLVIAEVGPPLDRDLYQADKGIKNTEAAVRDGGVLILDAACEHGVGLDAFVDLLRAAPTHARALEVVRGRGYRLGDHKAVRLRALTDTRGVHLGLVAPGIDPALAGVLGGTILPDHAAAANWATTHLATPAHGLVVEDAGNLTLTAG